METRKVIYKGKKAYVDCPLEGLRFVSACGNCLWKRGLVLGGVHCGCVSQKALARVVYDLDQQLPETYRELERATQNMIVLGVESHAPPGMHQEISFFAQEFWDKNYQFGRLSQINSNLFEYQKRDKEPLSTRLAFLELPEHQRVDHLKKACSEASKLVRKIMGVWMGNSQKRKFTEEQFFGNFGRREKSTDLFNLIPFDKQRTVYLALVKSFHPDKTRSLPMSDKERVEQQELLKTINMWWRNYSQKVANNVR